MGSSQRRLTVYLLILTTFHPGSNKTQQNGSTSSSSRTRRLSVCILIQARSNACKVGLRTDTGSCEQPSKCVSPEGPTEGCGVIPVKGRSMCIDPDPGGFHAAGLTVILTPDRPCCTIPLILCRRALCDSHLRFTCKHASKYSQAGLRTVLLLHVFHALRFFLLLLLFVS